MIYTIDTPLYQTPKPLNAVSVNITYDVNLSRVGYTLMVKSPATKTIVTRLSIKGKSPAESC